ncbi:MAG: PorT family protein [Bacteroidales bacterium]|nr:PorT family protein [Bacteroidales bacterium]MCF8389651.1 PorT family protein [Bacteroidales bacterium]
MKKFTTTIAALFVAALLIAQTGPTKYGKVEVLEEDGKTTVQVGGEAEVIDRQDTTKIKIGKKGVTIIENEEGSPTVTWENIEEIEEPEIDGEDDGEDNGEKKDKNTKFKPHWAGFEIGLNSYVNEDFSMNIEPGYMDLNTGKSWNYNINFLEQDIKLIGEKLGLVTGLGFEISNYHFDEGNVITEVNGVIERLDPPTQADKARLQTVFLNAPLLLEFQVPAGKKEKFFISAGVIGGVKLSSKTKLVYYENGEKNKEKAKDDFNINPLRYGFTGRIGYKALKLYANFYPQPLFKEGGGPVDGENLYPFSVGLSILKF